MAKVETFAYVGEAFLPRHFRGLAKLESFAYVVEIPAKTRRKMV